MNIRKRYSAVKRELIERCGGRPRVLLRPNVSEFLREMKAAGYKVIVHVSRPREEESAMMDYLEAVGIAELVSEFNFGERIKGGCIAEGVWTMRELADAIHRAAGREIN